MRPHRVRSRKRCPLRERSAGGTGKWRRRGAGFRLRFGMSGADMARAWRGHFLFPQCPQGWHHNVHCGHIVWGVGGFADS
eukprot:gene7376-biopygen1502